MSERPAAPEGAESITEEELAGALAELGVRINGNAYFPELARNIFGYIKAHREPRHKPGAYEDSEGNLYMRVHGLNAWLRVMDDGTTEVRPDDWVERPLRAMVPAPTHGELVKAVTPVVLDDYAPDAANAVADAVLRLMEGGSDE